MKVNAEWPVHCPRCGVNLSGTIGEEVEEPEVCEHELFHHYSCDVGDDEWFHIAPEFAHAYLTALLDSEEYKEWMDGDEEEESPVRRVESQTEQGVPLAKAMEGIPFFDTVAASVCGENTIAFRLVRGCFEYTELVHIGVDCCA